MKSGWLTLVIVIGLIAGVAAAAFFLFKPSDLSSVTAQMSPAPAAVATQVAPAEAPDLEGVPPMPEVADAAAPEAAPVVAGAQPGGPFSMTDHNGVAVTEKSWPGKYKLVFFGFTNCPDICPAAMTKVAAVMDAYDPKGDKIVPLLFTVDPARDTVAVMADYVSKFHATIVGLTGTEEQVKAAESAYKVYSAKRPAEDHGAHGGHNDYMVDHSGYIYLMSPDDALLDVIGTDATPEDIIAKIKLHLGG